MQACDNCRTAAYDLDPSYFISLPQDQAGPEMDQFAFLMGADLPDHVCDLIEDPDCPLPCNCSCRPASARAAVRA